MTIRVGVDVGGTFTKAVAFDTDAGGMAGEAIVATTHDHPDGVAAGVVEVVARLARQVGAGTIELVTHSTTQAVNALLEGDIASVGMIGMGRAPDLRKARRRTVATRIELGDGRFMATIPEFLDVTGGLDRAAAAAAIERVRALGAETIAVAEAFAPDDTTNERTMADAAIAAGLPVTTSAELTGLYGLELRAVTAALNASILPIALRTAEVVESGVAAAGVQSPVMVMRGDGGATDLAGFRRAPARTLYSGPAASVAGALRSGRIDDGVIVEVGGTSTNVAAIRRGRPALSYVQVASHATAIRALDVRVIGVAGGSMLRARRNRVYGVGPRSAHIAGCAYSSFLTADALVGARIDFVAPRPGDPPDYVVLQLSNGRRAALTNTCAANLLGLVDEHDYAHGDRDAARAAFAVAGAALRLAPEELARRMLEASTQAVGDLVAKVIRDHRLENPVIVAVGGGAGALGRAVAAAMKFEVMVPPHAEVISALGDALSLVRSEREQTFTQAGPEAVQALIAEVEGEAIAAGASAASLDVRVEQVAERGAVRVTVTGAVALESGAVPGRRPASDVEAAAAAASRGFAAPELVGQYWVATVPGQRRPGRSDHTRTTRLAVFDRYADLVLDVHGEVIPISIDPTNGTGGDDVLAAALERHTRRVGPMTIAPEAWLISGPRFLQVGEPDPHAILATAAAIACPPETTTIIVGRNSD